MLGKNENLPKFLKLSFNNGENQKSLWNIDESHNHNLGFHNAVNTTNTSNYEGSVDEKNKINTLFSYDDNDENYNFIDFSCFDYPSPKEISDIIESLVGAMFFNTFFSFYDNILERNNGKKNNLNSDNNSIFIKEDIKESNGFVFFENLSEVIDKCLYNIHYLFFIPYLLPCCERLGSAVSVRFFEFFFILYFFSTPDFIYSDGFIHSIL
jgi:hypothetical protein